MNKLILGGVLAAILPATAMAQPNPNCVASNQASRAEGTVLGAGAGALLGSALAGRHSRGEGAVLGAVGGGVAGNVIAGSRNDPCPPGYYYGPNGPPPPAAYGAGYGYAPRGFWRGAPNDIASRIRFLQDRIYRMSSSGRLTPPEAQRANGDLNNLRAYIRNNRWDYGSLAPDQRSYVQARLDHLAATLRWDAAYGY